MGRKICTAAQDFPHRARLPRAGVPDSRSRVCSGERQLQDLPDVGTNVRCMLLRRSAERNGSALRSACSTCSNDAHQRCADLAAALAGLG